MKKRIIKIVLPLLAFVLATAFAFATDQKSSRETAPETGYIFKNDQCTWVDMECNNQSDAPCLYNGDQVYYSNTSCSVPMTHRPE